MGSERRQNRALTSVPEQMSLDITLSPEDQAGYPKSLRNCWINFGVQKQSCILNNFSCTFWHHTCPSTKLCQLSILYFQNYRTVFRFCSLSAIFMFNMSTVYIKVSRGIRRSCRRTCWRHLRRFCQF